MTGAKKVKTQKSQLREEAQAVPWADLSPCFIPYANSHSQILKFKENQTTLYYQDVHRNTIPSFKMLLLVFFFPDEYFSITNVSIHP